MKNVSGQHGSGPRPCNAVDRRRHGKQQTDSGTARFPFWLEWAKALGPALAVLVSAFALVISVLTFRFGREIGRWQQSLSRAQMRQNVYDRRFRIYESAKALLVTF